MTVFSFASWKGGKGAPEEIKSLGNTFGRKLGKKISRAVVIYNCEYIYIFTGNNHEIKIPKS